MENEAKDSFSLPDSDKPEINLHFTVDDFD
jgi:hypothetical protein